MDKKTINWNGIIDADVLKSMKCRVWSKKEFPLSWSGENIEIVNYDKETGVISAHIMSGTYIFHISSVIISVQEEKESNLDSSDKADMDSEPKVNATRLKKTKKHHQK